MPRRRKHDLFCNRQLRRRRLANHFGGRAAGRHAPQLSTLRQAGNIDIAEATGLLAARCKYGSEITMDEYIAAQQMEARSVLDLVRKTIRNT